MSPGAAAVVTNGRRYLVYDDAVQLYSPLTAADFELLENHAIGSKLALQVTNQPATSSEWLG